MPSEESAVHRDYSPEIYIFVAEYGMAFDDAPRVAEERLAFHSLDEAMDWATRDFFVDRDDVEKVSPVFWRAELDMGNWVEIRKVRITQPNRLLRDDRDDE